ncbi:Uncharacterised protein [Mycobacteroides abscessus]|nr:Uncharacterised protein [Mycobacteroides abscessus]
MVPEIELPNWVSIKPKYAIPTPTPVSDSSIRNARASASTPHFEAMYALNVGPGSAAAADATTIMYPRRGCT